MHLRGLDGAGPEGDVDLVLGPGEQLDGAVLAEALPVHLEVHGAVVGLDAQRHADLHQAGDVAHGERGGGGCPRLSPLRSRAEQSEAARERKRRREEEEEGLPERSRHSPSQKQRTMDLVCPSPLITAQRLGAGFPLPRCPSVSLLSFPVPLSLPVPPVPVPSRWPPPRPAPFSTAAPDSGPEPGLPGRLPSLPVPLLYFHRENPTTKAVSGRHGNSSALYQWLPPSLQGSVPVLP